MFLQRRVFTNSLIKIERVELTEAAFFCRVNSYSSFKHQVTLHPLQEALPAVLRRDSLPAPLDCICISTRGLLYLEHRATTICFHFYLSDYTEVFQKWGICALYFYALCLADILAHSTLINVNHTELSR